MSVQDEAKDKVGNMWDLLVKWGSPHSVTSPIECIHDVSDPYDEFCITPIGEAHPQLLPCIFLIGINILHCLLNFISLVLISNRFTCMFWKPYLCFTESCSTNEKWTRIHSNMSGQVLTLLELCLRATSENAVQIGEEVMQGNRLMSGVGCCRKHVKWVPQVHCLCWHHTIYCIPVYVC